MQTSMSHKKCRKDEKRRCEARSRHSTDSKADTKAKLQEMQQNARREGVAPCANVDIKVET